MKKKIIKVPLFHHHVTVLQGEIDHVLSYLSNLHGTDVASLNVD